MKKIDYTKFSDKGEADSEKVFDRRWWLANKTERASAISGVVKLIAKEDGKRQTQYQMSARLYGNADMIGISGLTMGKTPTNTAPSKERLTYNVVQSAIDTVTSKMAKNKPKPLFLTSGGDYKIQRKAKKLDKFVEGVFYENKAYELGITAFRDSCILADGIVHVFEQHDRVKYQRVLPGELYVDWLEAFYGEPRQMHRVKNIDRDVLMELFPDAAAKIKAANAAGAGNAGTAQNVSDQVTVTESWHLASGPEASDGLHCITIEEGTLFEEEWKKPFFPFARLSFSKRLWGYWSQSGAEQIQSIQLEINKILWIIQRSMHLAGSFKVLIQNGSKVVKEHVNNDIGALIYYNGTAPQYVTPPIVPVEYYNHLQTLKNAAFEQFGISQLSASSQKPAGLNSGKALREYNDIETERFMTIGQAYEAFYLELARLTISVAKDIFGKKKGYPVKVPGKKFIQTIDWKDIDLEDDEYVMKMFPVSSLPSDPAGRLQTIQEYAQAGYISPRTARRLSDFPDLEQVDDLLNSEEEYIHMIMDKIIDDGVYTQIEPYDDIELAHEIALEYYAQGKCNGLEEEKLDLLRQFIDRVNLLKGMANPQPAQAPMGAPQANPAAPPTSDMLPNVPGMAPSGAA